MSVNPRVSNHTYNTFGRRITKTHNYVTQHYLYHNQNIIAILNEDKELQATIIHHPSRTDTPLSITNHQTGKTYYYHRNHQGSIIALTNEYGEIAESIIYDGDFGEEFIHIRQEITFNPYGYTGREYDLDDLYYYRARYYDPNTQRFLSMDPIEFEAGDVNFYRYVGNDAVNFVDPSGLLCISVGEEEEVLETISVRYDKWKVQNVNQVPSTNVGVCYWRKYKITKKHIRKRKKELCLEKEDSGSMYGQSSSVDLKIKYGQWKDSIKEIKKVIGTGHSSGIGTTTGWECGPGPSPLLPHGGVK